MPISPVSGSGVVRPPANTSGGEQQMCVIGRALMSRPKMILLDEPSMASRRRSSKRSSRS